MKSLICSLLIIINLSSCSERTKYAGIIKLPKANILVEDDELLLYDLNDTVTVYYHEASDKWFVYNPYYKSKLISYKEEFKEKGVFINIK